MKTDMRNSRGELTAYAFGCGAIQNTYGPLRSVALWRPGQGSDYVVAVLTGTGQRLTRRANFIYLSDARKFAARMLKDLTAPAAGGVDTL